MREYLRYRVTPGWHVHLGGQINKGGVTRVNGAALGNPAENRRVALGVTWLDIPGQRWMLRAGKDRQIGNGFKTDREVTLRLLQNF